MPQTIAVLILNKKEYNPVSCELLYVHTEEFSIIILIIYNYLFTLHFKVLLVFNMDSKLQYFEDLKSIKKIMEESSRFLSLSGLSGLFAGLTALLGATAACIIIFKTNIFTDNEYFKNLSVQETDTLKIQLAIDAFLVLLIAVGMSAFFSYRKARKQNLKIWTPVSKRLLTNLLVPLVSGGIFIFILFSESQWQLIVPSMLIFYGLALVNAGKFTYSEVFYLGIFEIITGLCSAFFPVYAIFFWSFGFGILHIAYGLFMYRKYEG